GKAPEQRLHCSAHFLLHQLADHRQQALVPWHQCLLDSADTRTRLPGKGSTICWASSGESCWRCSGVNPAFRPIGTRGADTCGYTECAVGAVWRALARRAGVGACIRVRRDPVPLTMLLFFAGPSAGEPGCRRSGTPVRPTSQEPSAGTKLVAPTIGQRSHGIGAAMMRSRENASRTLLARTPGGA